MTPQVVDIFFQIVVFLFAISVHESAHAWMALRRGDNTAYMLGRVTLNPIKHIDPVGTILLPLIAAFTGFPMIGWAKPTPVNTRNFKNLVLDDILTTVAGPISNLLVAIGALIFLFIIARAVPGGHDVINTLRLGHNVYSSESVLMPISQLFYYAMFLNILLAVFNLIPIPPLDGSHVIRHFLPATLLRAYDMIGMFGLLLLMLVGGKVLRILVTPVMGLFDGLLGTF
jgi:Zn-dependent protease